MVCALRVQRCEASFWVVLEPDRPTRITPDLLEKGLGAEPDALSGMTVIEVRCGPEGWVMTPDPRGGADSLVLADDIAVDFQGLRFVPVLPTRWNDVASFRQALSRRADDLTLGRTSFETYLDGHERPAWLLLDGAASDEIAGFLTDEGTEMVSLLQGRVARELMLEAPYLVRVAPRCGLTKAFFETGIAEDWGIALVSEAARRTLIDQLRGVLWAKVNSEKHFFRYYDPRIARDWILGLEGDQKARFFGGSIAEILVPGIDGVEVLTQEQGRAPLTPM